MNVDSEKPRLARMQTSKPVLSSSDVMDLLRKRYGIEIAQVKEFNSYDDRTYYVKTKPGCGVGERSEFVAKLLNSTSTALKEVTATQTGLLAHLKAYPELGCQFALPNLAGDMFSYEMIPNDIWDGEIFLGRERRLSVLRLFNFVPGKPLSAAAPFPLTFYFDAGRHLGKLQQALQEYQGDVEPLKLKALEHWWCLSSVPLLRSLLPLVVDEEKRRLVEEVISQFEATVVPVIDSLRKGIVQNDFNDDNVLVVNTAKDTSDCKNNCAEKFEITGVIDFDDSTYSCLVYDIAVAMMYATYGNDEPITAAAYMLTGFETVSPLADQERGLLRVLVAGRFAQSLLMSLVQSKNSPDNAYVRQSAVKGWSLLGKWWNQSELQLQELWDSVKERCTGQH